MFCVTARLTVMRTNVLIKRRYLYLHTTFYVFLPTSGQSRQGRPEHRMARLYNYLGEIVETL